MLEWADPDAMAASSWRSAFRVLDMQAPRFSGDLRLATFRVMWRSAMDDLADALVRSLAANRAVGVAMALDRR